MPVFRDADARGARPSARWGRITFGAVALALLVLAGREATAAAPRYRNLFREYLNKSELAIEAKITAAWAQYTTGDETSQRLYYPDSGDASYILDAGNNDVRSEGMSYGMMIAVQLDRREEFDRLWTWAKRHMYHAEGPRRGYFAWQCARDGRQLDPGSASDGEEWLATALLFASHRWGDGRGLFDYRADAVALLQAMLNDQRGGQITAIFDLKREQIVFAPTREGSAFTDPSYHLPAFYPIWASADIDASRRAFWERAKQQSRVLLQSAAHPQTGLMPEYCHFDGRPYLENTFGPGKGDFRFDAWRTLGNVALDHAWNADAPEWEVELSNRALRFLGRWGEICPNQFTLSGAPLSTDTSLGLIAMAAVAGLAADRALAQPFVERLWNAPIPEGQWRYYDGLLYLLALLQVSGRFQIHAPLG